MFIVRPDLEAEEKAVVVESMKEAIVKNQGEVNLVDDWGLRRLAYEIKKLHEGHYYLLYFTGPSAIIPELEHFFKVNDTVIRYMIVQAEQPELDAAMAKQKQAADAAQQKKAETPEADAEPEIVVEVEPDSPEDETEEKPE